MKSIEELEEEVRLVHAAYLTAGEALRRAQHDYNEKERVLRAANAEYAMAKGFCGCDFPFPAVSGTATNICGHCHRALPYDL